MEFTDIAYAKFLQAWPELSNLIVTFQDMSSELGDDSDIHIGIFILRSGGEYLYVPVVARGQGLFPIDSIFFSSKSKFFPLTRESIDLILVSQKQGLGKPSKVPQTIPQNPSVQHLVNPPRTGKFSYASASRLTDFLAALPNEVKEFVIEKVAEDKEVYNKLHTMFGLDVMFGSLRPTSRLENADHAKAVAMGVRLVRDGENLPTPQVASILTKGYAIDGSNPLTRVAIASEKAENKKFSMLTQIDGGYDYNIVMSTGQVRPAFVPVDIGTSLSSQKGRGEIDQSTLYEANTQYIHPSFLIFENGDYAISPQIVCQGEASKEKHVLKTYLEFNKLYVPREIERDRAIAIFDQNLCLVGAYGIYNAALVYEGVTFKARCLLSDSRVTIHAFRGYHNTPMSTNDVIFIPYNSACIYLGADVSGDLERRVTAAALKEEVATWGLLNSSLNLTYDNVDFYVNGKPVPSVPDVMEVLVVKNGIDPTAAESFVKKAMEDKKVVIYLSKQAGDFDTPGQIPQFGVDAPPQVNPWGTGSNFLPNMRNAVKTDDPQTVENTLISELLQSPDMFELIDEYLPDIEEAIDRLGRILLLGRINLSKLGQDHNADDVFNFMSLLKNVYRMLGENYIKLQRFAANVKQTK